MRGNLFDPSLPDNPFRINDIQVCADSCVAFGPCAPQLNCDIDNGASCNSGSGHCLPFEANVQGCSGDADCAPLPGTVCHTAQAQCLPPQDLCTP